MSSEMAPTAAARTSADLTGRDPAMTLAGLIDVLDRADGVPAGRRPQPRRAHRSARAVPLRSVPPAPMARRAPASAVVAAARPADLPTPQHSAAGRVSGLVRRLALWGSGPQGEYLAWRVPATRHTRRDGGRLAGLRRRLALWGAGTHGEYLAWGGPAARPSVRRDLDGPVVLREMPSTPTVQPAAPSPAAALVPAGPVTPPGRSARLPSLTRPLPRAVSSSTQPSSRKEAPPSTHAAAIGPIRARGDPWVVPVRGSPPARAPSPPPRWAPAAPG